MYNNLLRPVTCLYIIIYARLSKEEENKSKEEKSKSIRNQINICKEYIEDEIKKYPNCKFNIVAELYDDGISGTTFNRNAFNNVIKMLNNKSANMLITKDLSRFGREHINADNYIEKWFPEHNIRYVAILDGVDTYDKDNSNNDMTPIKNWMNEMYAKNTSRSIKKTFKNKMKKGEWIGGEPPLGYQIDPITKGNLILEPKGAEVVKLIYNLAKENKCLNEITDTLNRKKIPIPTIIKGNKRNLNPKFINLWSNSTVKKILQNEMYLGHIIQGKTTKLNFKSKKIIYLPKEDWIVVKNKIPPIIDEVTYNTAQLLFKSNKNKTKKSNEYLLKGLIRCAECNHSIGIQHYSNRKKNYTICNYYRKYGTKQKVCTAHRYTYEKIEELVLTNIKEKCLSCIDSTNFINILKNNDKTKQQINDLKIKIKKSNKNIKKLEKQIDIIYEDKLNEKIDIEQYNRMTQSKKNNIILEKINIINLKKSLNKLNNGDLQKDIYEKKVNDFLALKINPKLIILKLIDVIYLNENGTINIHYKIKKPT